jgi:group I intron endonuclease
MKALRLTTGALPLTASHPCRTINKIPLCLSVVSLSNLHGKAERDFCEANMQRICAIYSITCAANGKRYIGSTVDLTNRIYRHRYQLRHNKHFNSYLQHAWNKHGEASFAFETLEIVNEANRLERETFWIAHYKSCVPDFGYNENDIANASKLKPDALARIAEKKRGQKASLETRAKMSATHKALSIPPEQRERMSAASRRRLSRDYIVISPDGKEYPVNNLKAFCKAHGLVRQSMTDVALGRRKSCHGWKCYYSDALERHCDTSHALTEEAA